MRTAGKFHSIWVGAALFVASATATLAQYGPGYGQPGYGQPDYNNQPGYNQPYDQRGYGQPEGDFYDELAPHGQWVQTPEYGMVWMPNVEPGFQPYATNGHWVVTEYGNTWVSDYAWGWAPFHYGRWFMDRYNRWAWVPGYEWGPAWVSWRSGGGYYGWAPLGPGVNINVNINIPPAWWTFVPQAYITSPRLYSYYVPRPRVVNIYQNTTIINNVYRIDNRSYAYGPRREEIEYVTRRSVPVYRIENAGRPGRVIVRDNAVGIYRPDLSRNGWGNNRAYADRRENNRRDYNPAPNTYGGTNGPRGTYTGNPRSMPGTYNGNARPSQPTEAPVNQPRGQSTPGYSGRNPRFGQQPGQAAPQPAQPFPQAGRAESPSSAPWNRGRSGEVNTQPGNPQSRMGQSPVQEQRGGGYENRSQEQPSAPQGGFGERRSRGPR